MFRSRTATSRWALPLGVAATLTAAAGCALTNSGGWTPAGLGTLTQRGALKPLGATQPGSVQLEYLLIERPAGDPLLGDLLWNELDQIGALKPETRKIIGDQGLRVGIASTSPPAALQRLLGEAKEIVDHHSQEDARRLKSHRLTLRSGAESEAQTSDAAGRTLRYEVAGQPQQRTLDDARCLFRVVAAAEQDGWAKLEFVPELHHGSPQLRPVADAAGWQLKTGQDVLKLYAGRFTLTLNEGETAIVTATGDDPQAAGGHFFRAVADGVPVQRLLVVRLIEARGE